MKKDMIFSLQKLKKHLQEFSNREFYNGTKYSDVSVSCDLSKGNCYDISEELYDFLKDKGYNDMSLVEVREPQFDLKDANSEWQSPVTEYSNIFHIILKVNDYFIDFTGIQYSKDDIGLKIYTEEQLKKRWGKISYFDKYAKGGKIKTALKEVENAKSVKYWMQPEFPAESYDYPQKGKPNSFVKMYEEKYNADTILAYDKKGDIVGLFTISKGGDEKGAFKIVVREDSENMGWGKMLLDEAEKQGIDVIGNIKYNSFSHSGRNLLRSWLNKKMEHGGELGKGIYFENGGLVLYHGSPYEFKKFKLEKIGSGEGAQAFGWGLYFTEVKDIAKSYAKPSIDNEFVVNGVNLKGLIPYNLLIDINTMIQFKDKPQYFYGDEEKFYKRTIDALRNYALNSDNEQLFLNFKDIQSFNDLKFSRNLYTITLDDSDKTHQYTWLEWDKAITQNILSKVITALKKEGRATNSEIERIKINSNANGEDLYNTCVNVYGSTKEASLFLLRAGIDGIKYPTDTLSNSNDSKNNTSYNYVIFDENDIIMESIEKFRKGGELAKGIRAEMEHKGTNDKFKRAGVSDKDVATSIAKDHLKEDPKYYTKLMNMENKMANGGNLENINVESILDAIKDKIPANWVGDDVAEISVGNYIWEQINTPKSKNYISESEGKQQIMRDIFSMLFNREREKDSQYSLETGEAYAKIINLDIELFKKKFSIEKIRINDYLRAGIEFKNGDSIILDLTLNLKRLDQFAVRNTGDTFTRTQDIQYWLRNAIQYIDDNPELILANLKTTNKEWTSKPRGYVKQETMKQNETTQPVSELGTGAKVYFETSEYRVNDSTYNKGEYILNVGSENSEGVYNYYFDNVEMPVFIAKEIARIYPNGVPDALLVDKFVDNLKNKFNGNEFIVSINVKDYKNPYEVNRAIEKLLDAKGSEQESYTPDEINFISYYSGYGGLEKKGKFSDEELKGLLYEYYTPDEIVQKMWGLAYKYGYGSIGDNSVFEPSVGIGAFLKYAPENVFVAANEINRYSAMICHILYPNVETTLMSFEKNFISRNMSIKKNIEGLKKYSLVIGNPPYGKLGGIYIPMGEDKYVGAANWVEYFIFRGLDLLQKGGLLLYIVGAEQYAGGTLFLDSKLTKTKKAIFDKADLIDAYRLPNKLFERTGVSSEIVIFRKR